MSDTIPDFDLKKLIRTIPDYPKPGIMFRDITSLIEDPEGFRQSIKQMAVPFFDKGITHVAGIEARGFIFGAGLAIELGVGFIPIRKSGKLPGETIGQNYALEYGVDTIEMHANAVTKGDHVLLIDDLVATGGTALAAIALVRRTGATLKHTAFVIDLPELGGADKLRKLDVTTHFLMEFDGE